MSFCLNAPHNALGDEVAGLSPAVPDLIASLVLAAYRVSFGAGRYARELFCRRLMPALALLCP